MSYRLKINREPFSEVRRAVGQQIRKALSELACDRLSVEEKVHQTRKRLKKARAALHLVRPAFATSFSKENAYLREAAHRLAPLRDSDILISTLEGLCEVGLNSEESAVVEQAMELCRVRRRKALEEVDLGVRLQEVRDRLESGINRIKRWRTEASGFKAVKSGLFKTYKRARKGRVEAYQHPTPDAFHDWRKRVKYHQYHVQLLRQAWPSLFRARLRTLKDLSELLGVDHDLAVLAATVPDPRLALILRRRSQKLRKSADPLGAKLFVEEPKQYSKHVHAIWRIERKA